MIKEAIEKILSLAPVQRLTIDGREYTDNRGIYAVTEPEPAALKIHTLTGLVDYLMAHGRDKADGGSIDDMQGESIFYHVISHKEVKLRSELFGPFDQRKTFMTAELPESRGFPFGSWLDPESFIIALQSCFVQDDNTKALLAFVSSIKEVNERVSGDDGYSQTVTTKSGAVLVAESKVPNPVSLRPYRTFLEVEQPAISCVFRLQQGPKLALFEADGGLWRLEAIKNIRDYLLKELEEIGQKIPVIA